MYTYAQECEDPVEAAYWLRKTAWKAMFRRCTTTRCTAMISMSGGGGLYERRTKDRKLPSRPWIRWNEGEFGVANLTIATATSTKSLLPVELTIRDPLRARNAVRAFTGCPLLWTR